MGNGPAGRNAHRDRHDRGIRRPLLSKLFRHGQSRSHNFENYVETTIEYLKGIWVEELADVSWAVVDAPRLSTHATEVPRWRVDHPHKRIYIYRIPTERFGSHSRVSDIEERLKVEEQVFEAIGELINIDPWDLMPDHYNR